MTAQEALKALNDAAYLAARLLRKASDPRAERAKRIALETDDLVDGAFLTCDVMGSADGDRRTTP